MAMFEGLDFSKIFGTTIQRGPASLNPVKQELKLYHEQKLHAERFRKMLQENNIPTLRDTSETGLGKSVIAMSLAKRLGLSLFIVCPTPVRNAWIEKLSSFEGFENFNAYEPGMDTIPPGRHIIMTYDNIVAITKSNDPIVMSGNKKVGFTMINNPSTGTQHVSNSFFVRTIDNENSDFRVRKTKNGKFYKPFNIVYKYSITTNFIKLMQAGNGIEVVVDESHFTKNEDSIRSEVSRAICHAVKRVSEAKAGGDGVFIGEDGFRKVNIFNAAKTVSYTVGADTCAIMMSATPIDKAKQIPPTLAMMGICPDPVLVRLVNGQFTPTSDLTLKHVVAYAANFRGYIPELYSLLRNNSSPIVASYGADPQDPNTWMWDTNVLPNGAGVKELALEITKQIWRDVVIPATTSEMTPFIERNSFKAYINIDSVQYLRNESLPIDTRFKNTLAYKKAVYKMFNNVITSLQGKGEKGEARSKNMMLKQITESLGEMDEACYEGVCMFMLKFLINEPTSKVILIFSRVNVCAMAHRAMMGLCIEMKNRGAQGFEFADQPGFAARLWGGNKKDHGEENVVSPAEKQRGVSAFQEDSNRCRVLVMIIDAGIGIDLNDKSDLSKTPAGRPRYSAATPQFKVPQLHQSLGRVDRANSSTVGKSFVVYPLTVGTTPEYILRCARAKSDVLVESTGGTRKIEGVSFDEDERDALDTENPEQSNKYDRTEKRIFPANYPRYVYDSMTESEYFIDEKYCKSCRDIVLDAEDQGRPLDMRDGEQSAIQFAASLCNDDMLVLTINLGYDPANGPQEMAAGYNAEAFYSEYGTLPVKGGPNNSYVPPMLFLRDSPLTVREYGNHPEYGRVIKFEGMGYPNALTLPDIHKTYKKGEAVYSKIRPVLSGPQLDQNGNSFRTNLRYLIARNSIIEVLETIRGLRSRTGNVRKFDINKIGLTTPTMRMGGGGSIFF